MIKAIELLSMLSINQQGLPLPNIDRYVKYCLNCVSNLADSGIRIAAIEAIPNLINSIKLGGTDPNRVMVQGLAKIVLKVVLFSCSLEIEPKIIC